MRNMDGYEEYERDVSEHSAPWGKHGTMRFVVCTICGAYVFFTDRHRERCRLDGGV